MSGLWRRKCSLRRKDFKRVCNGNRKLTELNGFHFFLLNYDPDDRMQIRRQMKALLSEIRVQGDILKNLSVTLALGEGVGSLSEIGISLKNARLLIEERLLGGNRES